MGGAVSVVGLSSSTSGQDGAPISSDFDPIESNSWEILQGYLAGTLSAEEVVESYLDQIYENEDELGGVISINPNALERARELDEAVEPGGANPTVLTEPDGTDSTEPEVRRQLVGPLHGIPVLVKDNINTHDIPTTSGTVALSGTTPIEDAPVVKNIRDAGGIVIAKANMDEFAFGYTSSSSMAGVAYNPYNTERTAGGSSGGTGCGIGASYATIGIGTDTGGSVQIPSLANSLVGIRPTTQLISGEGISPLYSRQDTAGPMARTVADAAVMLDVLAAPDPGDTLTYQQYKNTPYVDGNQYTDYLNNDGLEDARIGVYSEWLPDGSVGDVFDNALSNMRSAGATIVSHLEPPPSELDNAYRGATINWDWENYLETIPGFDTVADILSTGETQGCGLNFAIGEPNTLDELLEEPEFGSPYYWQRRLQEYILEQMEENDLDAIMFPGNEDVPSPDYSVGTWGPADNQLSPKTDWPTITVPVGYTDEGLPVGMQLLGPQWSEPQLISLAYSYEQFETARTAPEEFNSISDTGINWNQDTIEEWNEERIVNDTVEEPCDVDTSTALTDKDSKAEIAPDTKNLPQSFDTPSESSRRPEFGEEPGPGPGDGLKTEDEPEAEDQSEEDDSEDDSEDDTDMGNLPN